jgi:hypothetical protein
VTLSLCLSRTELYPSRIETKCRRAFPPDTARSIASPLMCFHEDQIVRIGTDAMLEACVFLGQIVALRPHQAGFTFGQIRTDAAPSRALTQAKSGPLRRIKWTSSSVKLGPTPCSRRALTQAKSGPLRRIKQTSSSVKSGPTPGYRRALTQAKSGPYAASSGLHVRSNRDRRHAPGVRLLRPNRGLMPHQADFTFGHDDK